MNDDGEATFRDTALWIGRNLCSRQNRERLISSGRVGHQLACRDIADLCSHGRRRFDPDRTRARLMDDVLVRAVRGNPFLTPFTVPPQPWTGIRKGGLPVGHWACVPLIREHHRSIEEAARKA